MSAEFLEERVGQVEREQARQGEKLSTIQTDVNRISGGVEKLLERESEAPQSMSWPSIAAAAGGLATVMIVVWWLIEHSPAVQSLDKRVTRIDDKEMGLLRQVERRIDTLEGWKTTTRK